VILTLEQIEIAALELSDAERAQLAERLLSSLQLPCEGMVEQVWAEEAERRYEEMLRTGDEGVPAENVFKELRASLSK
jgi:putative addiction module component (TIGR02574 family)